MEPSESYSVKGDQFMKQANKTLKGIPPLIQALSSATSSATKLNVQNKPLSFTNKQQPTTNSQNAGKTPPEPTSNVSNVIRLAKVDKLLIFIKRQPM